MTIAVIDGQGGGIGEAIIRRLRAEFPEELTILALGTNAVATARMLKAGANDGASGENAVIRTVPGVDVIVGTISTIIAHSHLGEMTPAMTEAIAGSPALKVLVPLTRSPVEIVGVVAEPLPHYLDMLVDRIRDIAGEVS